MKYIGDGMKREYEEIVDELYEKGCVKFGDFVIKSGAHSPIYIDLRLLASLPDLLEKIASEMGKLLSERKVQYDLLAAVPYAAIPIATALSLETRKPMIYTRKEAKDYGTKKNIEGIYEKGQSALLVDDLVTTGLSKLEMLERLKGELVIKDILVVIDRSKNGAKELGEQGCRLHYLFTLDEMAEILKERIGKKKYDEVKKWLADQ